MTELDKKASSAHSSQPDLKMFDQKRLRMNLILSSLYLSAFELLEDSIILQISKFYMTDQTDLIPDAQERYKREVLDLDLNSNKSGKEFRASILWLKANQVIDDSEHDLIEAARKHRHKVAHELPWILVDEKSEINLGYLAGIRKILGKIDSWWIRNYHMAADERYDGQDTETTDVKSGPMILFDYILSIAFEEQSNGSI
jgi:hypothetical protein